MSWAFLDDIRDRLRRKVKPVVYIDLETRVMGTDPASLETLVMAYKIDDGPVKIIEINS